MRKSLAVGITGAALAGGLALGLAGSASAGGYPTPSPSHPTAPAPTPTPTQLPTTPPVVNPFAGCNFSTTFDFTFDPGRGRFVRSVVAAIVCDTPNGVRVYDLVPNRVR